MKVRSVAVDLPPERPARGHVVTFYSYKGGTGRSMALVNVAWMLALNGESVLVVDWDLEAPGLHRYFHPFLQDKELANTEGLLDFVDKQASRVAVSKNREKQDLLKKQKAEAGPEKQPEALASQASQLAVTVDDESAIIDYLVPLVWPNGTRWEQFGERARIDLIPAGRQGPSYSRTLSAFNWIDFFERLNGRPVLEAAGRQLRSVYDYILIDSRTGVSDTSGICTVELPDSLVVCFTLNDQSIIGASGITDSVLTQRQARPNIAGSERPFRIFPVPMRVDITSEHVKRQVALELAQEKFSRFLDPSYQANLSSYWGSVQMAYYPFYAFEEIPAVFGDTPNVDASLTNSIKRITGYLTDQTITSLPLLDSDPVKAEQKRKEIVGWFARKGSPVRAAQAAYDQLDAARQKTMLKVLERLVQVDPTGQNIPRRCSMEEVPVAHRELIKTLADRRVIEVAVTNETESVALGDPVILEKWELLLKAIQNDRPFLLWRQSLSASVQSWLSTGRDRSALWRGKLVEEALRWRDEHFDDLNSVEQDFLTQTLEEAKKENRMASLETVALDQKRWSLTAGTLKRDIERARWAVLILAIAGAFLAALALSLPYSFVAGYLGAAALGSIVVVKSQRLSRERLQAWILARAAAESFKREMYLYRTSSGPYGIDSGGTPDVALFERRDEILGKVRSIQRFLQEPNPMTVASLGALDANAYISERVSGQIDWFRGKADHYSGTQGTLGGLEYFLAIAGALLGAGLTFAQLQIFGAWVGVITTISGAVGAHVLAERYDQLIVSYRATADRLTGILGRWRANRGPLSQLVEQVEAALLEENQGWIAGADELLKDNATPQANAPSRLSPS